MVKNYTNPKAEEFVKDGIKYALSIGRRQPMTVAHVEAVKEIIAAGLIPIIAVGSTNSIRSRHYDPLKNPLNFSQQMEQIRRELPFLPNPIIVPFEDLGDQERWSKSIATFLQNPFSLKAAGLDVAEPILKKTVIHHLRKTKPEVLSVEVPVLNKVGLSSWASEIVNDKDQFVGTYSLLRAAAQARDTNPDGHMLAKAHLEPSLLDFTLARLYNETGLKLSNLLQVTGQACTQNGIRGAVQTYLRHNQMVQAGKNPLSLDQYLRHVTEKYDTSKESTVPEFLFHPATLMAMQSLGDDILKDLMPQGGFEHFIPAMAQYNRRMAKSMEDKVSYLQKCEGSKIIVDFGCANGATLKYMQSIDPGKHYIGYDISQPMIDLANTDNAAGITFTTKWQEVLDKVASLSRENGGKSVLVLSSLIHEVYHYLPKEEVSKFWDKVWNSDFDYIAIRDMMVADNVKRPSKPQDVEKIRANYDGEKIGEWEKQWGPLEDNRSMVHFLLTCPYKENWVRELQENYLPMSLQDFIKNIPDGYEIKMIDHYILPYFNNRTHEEFGFDVADNTHMKMVLQKTSRTADEVKADKQAALDVINAAPPGHAIYGELAAEKLEISQKAQKPR